MQRHMLPFYDRSVRFCYFTHTHTYIYTRVYTYRTRGVTVSPVTPDLGNRVDAGQPPNGPSRCLCKCVTHAVNCPCPLRKQQSSNRTGPLRRNSSIIRRRRRRTYRLLLCAARRRHKPPERRPRDVYELIIINISVDTLLPYDYRRIVVYELGPSTFICSIETGGGRGHAIRPAAINHPEPHRYYP